jgi:IclR family transcriptional regulator, KDG regulon repressor
MIRLATNSLERALVILQFIGKTPGGLTNLEVSKEFHLARSTCSYILSRLEKAGYLVRNKQTGQYRIGLKTLILGRGALREVGFRAASEPTLYRLATETGLAANLAVIEGSRVVVLDRIEGPAFVKAAIDESGSRRGTDNSSHGFRSAYLTREYREVGDELPVCTTALGKVLMAHMPEQALTSFLDQSPMLQRELSNPGAKTSLFLELADVRARGYCMMHYEPHNESCSLAAPIFDATDAVRAAVSVSCRRHLTIWNDERALSEVVREAAWEISCRLHSPKVVHSARSSSMQTANGDGGESRVLRSRFH